MSNLQENDKWDKNATPSDIVDILKEFPFTYQYLDGLTKKPIPVSEVSDFGEMRWFDQKAPTTFTLNNMENLATYMIMKFGNFTLKDTVEKIMIGAIENAREQGNFDNEYIGKMLDEYRSIFCYNTLN